MGASLRPAVAMSKRSARKRASPSLSVHSRVAPVAEPAAARRKGLPVRFIVTSLAATLNLTAAMVGLGFPEQFPALAAKPVMVTLFAVGIGLEVWATRQLLAARRRQIDLGLR